MLTGKKQVASRREQYYEPQGKLEVELPKDREPDIRRDQVKKAINKLKKKPQAVIRSLLKC